MITKDHMK
jgi:hypothetical protein